MKIVMILAVVGGIISSGVLCADELSAENRTDLLDRLGAAQGSAFDLSEKQFNDEGLSADLEGGNAQQLAERDVDLESALQRVSFVPTKAALESLDVDNLEEGDLVFMQGYVSLGDGAEGIFWLDKSSSQLQADGGVILATPQEGVFWRRLYDGASVNVRWFGATGAGYPSDDYPAILSAVSNYDYVLFPAGEYYVSSPIPFSVEQRFEGIGNISSVVDHGALIVGETDCFVSEQLGSNRDVNWLNLALSTRSPDGVGIRFDEEHTSGWNGNPVIQNCIFYSNLKSGILGTIQGGTILNSGFGTMGSAVVMENGIYLDSAAGNTSIRILSCKFRYMNTGILLEEANGVKITGCEFEMVKGVPVWLKGSSSVTISDTYFENCQTGPGEYTGFIRLDSSAGGVGCRGTFILGNYFLNNGAKNVSTFIDGQWVTGMTAIANYYAPMREGVAIYNQGVRRPMFAVGNILISNTFMPIDEINTFVPSSQ